MENRSNIRVKTKKINKVVIPEEKNVTEKKVKYKSLQ
jgi:hypothetical protein